MPKPTPVPEEVSDAGKEDAPLTFEQKLIVSAFKAADDNHKALIKSFSDFKWEFRVILILFVLGFAARDGVFSKISIPGLTFETHGATADGTTIEATTTAIGAASAHASEPETPPDAAAAKADPKTGTDALPAEGKP